MGSDGSLSLSEITVSPKEQQPPSKLQPSTPSATDSVDDDIEQWRNLDVSQKKITDSIPNSMNWSLLTLGLQNGLPCLLDKAKQDINVAKVSEITIWSTPVL